MADRETREAHRERDVKLARRDLEDLEQRFSTDPKVYYILLLVVLVLIFAVAILD